MHPNPFWHLGVDKVKALIDDTIFAKDIDREIAINVFVNSMAIEKCAEKIDYNSKSVRLRLPDIERRLENSLKRP